MSVPAIMRNRLAFLFSLAFVFAFPVLFFKAIPTENKDLVTYMLGQLSGIVLTIIAFHFSSTVGGEKKTDALADAAKNGKTGTMDVDADQVNVREKDQ